jgi:1,2-diacylglycerol 3-alpha-glucosyltransferase
MMVGRLSREKRQDLIIAAAARSKYSDKIQLVFAGNGPRKKYYSKLGGRLKKPPVFGYYSKDELIRLINQCDLYVHAAEAEIEAISCIEAFSCGLVPVIADAKLSATRQFALDPRCLFRNKSVPDLVRRIDYWIEHPIEKEAMSRRYVAYAQQYRVTRSVEKMEQVYRTVIAEFKAVRRHVTVPEPEEFPSGLLAEEFDEDETPSMVSDH